uniref:Uncharacterized protein n=1 Tax=Tetranychus urticae TaxID=32264 RepID=T1KX93_TETUR
MLRGKLSQLIGSRKFLKREDDEYKDGKMINDGLA